MKRNKAIKCQARSLRAFWSDAFCRWLNSPVYFSLENLPFLNSVSPSNGYHLVRDACFLVALTLMLNVTFPSSQVLKLCNSWNSLGPGERMSSSPCSWQFTEGRRCHDWEPALGKQEAWAESQPRFLVTTRPEANNVCESLFSNLENEDCFLEGRWEVALSYSYTAFFRPCMLRLGETRKSSAEALLGSTYLVTVQNLDFVPYNLDYLNIKK